MSSHNVVSFVKDHHIVLQLNAMGPPRLQNRKERRQEGLAQRDAVKTVRHNVL